MRSLALLLMLPTLIGCSNGSPRLAPVTGTVRLDGHPLKHGLIIFEANDALPAKGKILNGQIVEVTTHRPNDGLLLGRKRIAVRPSYASGDNQAIPNRYHDSSTSNLTWEIVDGPNNLVFSLLSEQTSPFTAQR